MGSKKNSPTGTTPMGLSESELSVEDVCSILKASSQAGVTELQFRGLHAHFGRTAETVDTAVVQREPGLTKEQIETLAQSTLETEQKRLREDRMAQALIEDPDLYEQMIRDGELKDAVDASRDEDDIDY